MTVSSSCASRRHPLRPLYSYLPLLRVDDELRLPPWFDVGFVFLDFSKTTNDNTLLQQKVQTSLGLFGSILSQLVLSTTNVFFLLFLGNTARLTHILWHSRLIFLARTGRIRISRVIRILTLLFVGGIPIAFRTWSKRYDILLRSANSGATATQSERSFFTIVNVGMEG